MESTLQKPVFVAAKTTPQTERVPMNRNKWVRQTHRWLCGLRLLCLAAG
jgi:hypothetical protein